MADQDLVEEIYSAAVDPSCWAELLPRLAHGVDADAFGLVLPTPAGEEKAFAFGYMGWNLPSFAECLQVSQETGRGDAYLEYAHRAGLAKPGYFGSLGDLVSEACWAENPWSEAVYDPYDLRGSMGFASAPPIPGARFLGVTAWRRRGASPFAETQLSKLRALQPHLERGARMVFLLQQRNGLSHLHETMINTIAGPVIAADFDGRIIFANRAAEAEFVGGLRLRIANGRLTGADPIQAQTIERALNGAAKGRGSDGLIWSGRQSAAFTCMPFSLGMGRRCAIFAMVLPIDTTPVRPRLKRLFGLTDSEAEVVCALAQGDTAEEIAQARSVAEATVRSQIKSAMAKLHVHRQAHAVSIVSRLSRLGPTTMTDDG